MQKNKNKNQPLNDIYLQRGRNDPHEIGHDVSDEQVGVDFVS